MYCLDAERGEEVWKTKAAERGGLVHSSVVVVDGVAVVLADSLVGLDAATGEVRWRQAKVRGRDNSPVLWKSGGKMYVICNTGKNVACVDVLDGQVRWTVPGGGQSTVAVVGDTMAVLSGSEKVGLTAYKLSPEKAETLWSKTDFRDGASSPVIHDGHVYAFAGKLAVCVNLASGKLAWEQKIKGRGYTSPVVADGKIFVVVGPTLQMIQATPEKFNLLAKAQPPLADYSSPAIVDGKLYLRLKAAVACYDLTTAPAEAPPSGQ